MKPEVLIKAGMIAAQNWKIDPAEVYIMLIPEAFGTQIIVRGRKPLQDHYIIVEWQEDIVHLQRWKHSEGWEIWMAYSESCNTLVIRI